MSKPRRWLALVPSALAAVLAMGLAIGVAWCAVDRTLKPEPEPVVDEPSANPIPGSQKGGTQIMRMEQRRFSGEIVPVGGDTEGGADTIISVGGGTTGMAAQVEMKPAGEPFDETGLQEAALDGTHGAAIRHNLPEGRYHWRARLRAELGNGGWIDFNTSEPVHFVVPAPRGVDDPNAPRDRSAGRTDASSSGGGEGRSSPNPSEIEVPSSLWSRIFPVAQWLALGALVAAAAAGVLRWRARRARLEPGP